MNFAATPSRPVTGSFTSIFQGNLGITDSAFLFADTFLSEVDTTVHLLVIAARADLRSRARALPGWNEIADQLDVSFDGVGFMYYGTTPEAEARANELEFGTDTTAPTGFLRKLAISHSRQFEVALAVQMRELVPSA